MKIRTGFVSNSSSSSFCLYGIYTDSLTENKKLIQKLIETEDNINTTEEAEEVLAYDWYSAEKILGEIHCIDYDGFYIGESWASIKDDETGAQFKKRVEEKLKEYFPNKQCSTFEKAWRDG